MATITTSFGAIREWRSADAEALVKYANNRKVWLNLRDAFPHPYSAASAQAFLDMAGRQDPATSFAIATKEEAIGAIPFLAETYLVLVVSEYYLDIRP